MMNLEQRRDALPLEAFDPPALPERSRSVQRLGMQKTCQFGQRRTVTGLGDRHAVDVIRDVEILVLDPVRPIDSERRFEELPFEPLDEFDPLVKDLEEALETKLRTSRRIENRETCYVRGRFRGFDRNEDSVSIRELPRMSTSS
jgi:hypothetical protein